MDRLEYIRTKIDRIIMKMEHEEARKYAYIHLYGVSSCATLLAIKRHLSIELAALAGMLHDIARCHNFKSTNHALEGSEMARAILQDAQLFTREEIECVVHAILVHSEKMTRHGVYDELLKDSDVLDHYLYQPNNPVPEKERKRLYLVLEELNLK